jgi:glycosyltransferase involved in cell wall biosynthesis
MKIVWLDAFHGGSHAAVAEGYARHSRHTVHILALPIDGGWRWRMRGAAVSFARMLRERPDLWGADLVVATDMLDLATFLGLTRDILPRTPVALYMHENQLTYPLPSGRKLDLSFPWINYTALLAADAICFNSAFHRDALLAALPGLPARFHDFREPELLSQIAERCHVLHPGIELLPFDQDTAQGGDQLPDSPGPPVILWNSRWEYDKAPDAFFTALRQLAARGGQFRLIIAGEHIDPSEPNFAAARTWAEPRCLWWGYAPDPAAYRALLRRADIVVSTAIQEFFGIAVLEAIYAGCVPILPRRLSYPELLPPELHEHYLYDDADDLVTRLEVAIAQIGALRRPGLREIADRFRWERQAPIYDTLLETIAGGRASRAAAQAQPGG